MRILMLNNEFPPLGGGTGVVNYHLLEEMSVSGDLYIDLVVSSRTRSTYETEQFAPRITIHKVPVNNKNIHHSSNRELLTYTWKGILICRRLLKQHRYDLSFAFAGVPAGAISYALKLTNGLPYLVSLQGPDVPGFEARYNYLYPLLKPLLRCIWRNALVVTAISGKHQRLAYQTMPELEIPIIHNGVDTRIFHPAGERREAREINILCVGRLIERKGQHHLLQAFASLRAHCNYPITLTLVGTGDAGNLLYRPVNELGIADAVSFTGFVPRDEMPAIYRRADIFVLPSQNEGMSIALLEAMASGLPVVVTDTGGTAELVQENVNGHIVPWHNVQALTKALATLVRDEVTRSRMGRENRQIATQFSWSAMAQKYLELCVQITDRSTPASALAQRSHPGTTTRGPVLH
jgi:glycosyltransferase involved in cell wall biosynthesis